MVWRFLFSHKDDAMQSWLSVILRFTSDFLGLLVSAYMMCVCVYLRSTAYAVSGTRLTCFRVTFRMLTDILCFRRRTTRSSTSARRNSQAETYGGTTAERTQNSSRPINEEEERRRLTKSISVIIIVISYGISIRAKTFYTT